MKYRFDVAEPAHWILPIDIHLVTDTEVTLVFKIKKDRCELDNLKFKVDGNEKLSGLTPTNYYNEYKTVLDLSDFSQKKSLELEVVSDCLTGRRTVHFSPPLFYAYPYMILKGMGLDNPRNSSSLETDWNDAVYVYALSQLQSDDLKLDKMAKEYLDFFFDHL